MQRLLRYQWWFLGIWILVLSVGIVFVIHRLSQNLLVDHLLGELAEASANKSFSAEEKHLAHVAIFEKYWTQIPSGTIIDALSHLPRSCHVLGHTVGKLLVRTTSDISEALALCKDSCQGGCFHGVLMGLFGEDERASSLPDTESNQSWLQNMRGPKGHIGITEVAKEAPAMCHRLFTSGRWAEEEECAHGMGHVYMMATGNRIDLSERFCQTFPVGVFQYYCAGGIFMEREDKTTVPADPTQFFAHCVASQVYPEAITACYRYSVRWVVASQGSAYRATIRQYCESLSGLQRKGCFHGYGFSAIGLVVKDPSQLATVCDQHTSDEQKMCLDGVLIGLITADKSTHTTVGARACAAMADGKAYCLQTLQRGFYGAGNHDYAPYSQ